MRQRIYGIYDVKAEAVLGVLQLLSTDAQAVRMFEGVCRTSGTMVHEHPEDFVLVCVGVLDFDTCIVTPTIAPLAAPIAHGVTIARASSRAREVSPVDVGQQ